jgi:hypothetical protein
VIGFMLAALCPAVTVQVARYREFRPSATAPRRVNGANGTLFSFSERRSAPINAWSVFWLRGRFAAR